MRDSLIRLSVPRVALRDIPDHMCYVRKRGGKKGLRLTPAPHLVLSPAWPSFIAYSDEDFVIPPRTMGIAAPEGTEDQLRALCVYLNSSLASYYTLFHAPQWGVFRQANQVTKSGVGAIPTPQFTEDQAAALAALHKTLAAEESRQIRKLVGALPRNLQQKLSFGCDEASADTAEECEKLTGAERDKIDRQVAPVRAVLQKQLDSLVFRVLCIPEYMRALVTDLIQTRLLLDKPARTDSVTRPPKQNELLAYARELQAELDRFVDGKTHHRVVVTYSDELIECVVKVTKRAAPVKRSSIRQGTVGVAKMMAGLSDILRERFSQWVYVQRGLRLYDGPNVHIYRAPRLIDWTRTQAINDADAIIGEAVAAGWGAHADC